ncbi:hypothetical protein SEPCBS119000_006121 [Sporothrix epigloea]|uniref:Delta 8-(E)-sphingolipid desaturase n=1 Tax=Sporothrix epigloea TaxID=1892477 RepID=A0ABP0E5G3_9PEZI
MANSSLKAPGRAGFTKRPEKTYPLMSRREIEALIAQGRKLIIVDQHVLKVDAWLPFHPGGAKSIMHMVGKDATDEVTCLHSAEALQSGVFRASCSEIPESSTGSVASTDSTTTCSGSESSSRSASPPLIFDDEDVGVRHESMPALNTRQRRPFNGPPAHSRDKSSFDGSDVEDKDTAGSGNDMANEKDALRELTSSFLDAKTREEIRLDLDKYPSLDPLTQQNVVLKYRELHEKMRAAGLFDCNYTAYAWEISRYIMLFTLMLVFLHMKWYAVSAAFLGAFWHQLVFTAHDAGHMGITHSFHGDTVIGIVIADFLGGLSICWWKDNHNVHHIVTNSPEHDPDIEHMPFFAISHRFLHSLRSTYYDKVMDYDAAARFFLSIQAYSYYLILCFGRFNLYRLSWQYIILGLGPRKGPAWWHRWLEAAGQVFFWTWFGYGVLYKGIDTNWGRFVFVMVSHIMTMPLHLQITLSHFAMSTADLGPHESFPQRMLRTTMDVDCPQWLDFFHGGLQFQAIHHLYPRMPRHNLRAAQKLIQDFCNEVQIPYALYGFVDGNKEVLGRLADVSRQAAILAQCQRAIIEGKA